MLKNVKAHTSQRPKRPELIVVHQACLGLLLLPPGRDASPSQGHPRPLPGSLVCCRYPFIPLASVVQEVNNAIDWINLWPLHNAIGSSNTYPLDSDIYPVDSAIQLLNNRGQGEEKQQDGQGLNPGPLDPKFEMLTVRPLTPPQKYLWQG